MAFKLYNEKELPKAFPENGTDRNTTQMPLLIADGRVPVNVAYVMRRKLNPQLTDWLDNYFDTGDAFLYHPDGKVKYVHDAQQLREISKTSELVDCALEVAEGTFDSAQGLRLSKKDIARYAGKDISAKKAKENKIWRIAARHPDEVPKAIAQDAALLDAYVDTIFARYQEKFAADKKIEDLRLMGVCLDSTSKVEKMRAACVDWLEYGSQLDGRRRLDYDSGRLVGVAPETLNAAGTLILQPTLALIVRLNFP
jgi:hypothetical protein